MSLKLVAQVYCRPPPLFFLLIHPSLLLSLFLSSTFFSCFSPSYLSSLFPDISFTVQAKADLNFKIVGAASVAAKVTRDAWVEGWMFEENQVAGGAEAQPEKPTWGSELGSGYPSGRTAFQGVEGDLKVADAPARPEDAGVDQELP